MTPTSTTKPLEEFIRISEHLLSDEITGGIWAAMI